MDVNKNFYIKQIKKSDIKFPLKINQINGYRVIDFMFIKQLEEDYKDMYNQMIKNFLNK